MAGHVVDRVYVPDGEPAMKEAVWERGQYVPSFSRIVRRLSNLEVVLANSCYLCANELASVDKDGKCLRIVLAVFLRIELEKQSEQRDSPEYFLTYTELFSHLSHFII